MNIIPRNILRKYFGETVNQTFKIDSSTANPFIIESLITGLRINIFLKNLSPAYFKNLPDITRIQVAKNRYFEKIKSSKEVCIPIGYDCEHDVFIIWNPWIFTLRVNEKGNISIYSRRSAQKKCMETNIVSFKLSNDEIVYCVNPSYLSEFLLNLEAYFISKDYNINTNHPANILIEENILIQIHDLLRDKQILFAVQLLIEVYEKTSQKLSINDAFRIINLEYKYFKNL